jgi:hypothetical protein
MTRCSFHRIMIDVKIFSCNDYGENKSFHDSCRTLDSQSNGKLELKLQTFYWRISVTFNNGGLEDSVRTGVWAECTRKQPSSAILSQLR